MPSERRTKAVARSSESAGRVDITLVGVARSIGETLGKAAAKAGDAAKEIETFSHAVGKSTMAATRKLYKRAKKKLRARAANRKSGVKKRKASKKRSRIRVSRGK